MSRIGKKIITLRKKLKLLLQAGKVVVKGPKATLERATSPSVTVTVAGKEVRVAPVAGHEDADVVSGTTVSHIENMIAGVTEPYTKKLLIEGIGYKADVKGAEMGMSLGFSHQIHGADSRHAQSDFRQGRYHGCWQ